jgi:integrase
MLRHTFCSRLAMRGASPRAIQELARHCDLSTTQRYLHVNLTEVQSAIQLLEGATNATVFADTVGTGTSPIEKVSG